AYGSYEDSDVNKGGREHRPGRRQPVVAQIDHDNVKTLKPHSDIDDECHNKGIENVSSQFFEEEGHRNNAIANDQCPKRPPIRTGGSAIGKVGIIFKRASG